MTTHHDKMKWIFFQNSVSKCRVGPFLLVLTACDLGWVLVLVLFRLPRVLQHWWRPPPPMPPPSPPPPLPLPLLTLLQFSPPQQTVKLKRKFGSWVDLQEDNTYFLSGWGENSRAILGKASGHLFTNIEKIQIYLYLYITSLYSLFWWEWLPIAHSVKVLICYLITFFFVPHNDYLLMMISILWGQFHLVTRVSRTFVS